MADASKDTATPQPSPTALDDPLRNLVDSSELIGVRITKWHAELLSEEPAEISEIDLRVSNAFRYHDKGFDTRFSVDIPLSSANHDTEIASIQIEIIASFSTEGSERPDREALAEFMEQVALFVVMPFIREGLHSLSMRIGLQPITLGLLHQGKQSPTTAWVTNTRDDPEPPDTKRQQSA